MKQRLGIGIALFSRPKLLVLDEPTNGLDPIGIQELREMIRKFPEEGITVIVSSHILSEIAQTADHIGIIVNGALGYQGGMPETDRLEELFMKIAAKELNVPILLLSQMSREVEKRTNKKPQMSDLRESGAIEQDADMVMFINRPDVGATDEDMAKKKIIKGMAYLNIAKNRHGGLDRIPLRFKGELTKFVNPEFNEDMEARADDEEARAEGRSPHETAAETTPLLLYTIVNGPGKNFCASVTA